MAITNRGVHCPIKYELKSSHFTLISDVNLLLWYIGGPKGIFYHAVIFLEGQTFFRI